MLLISDIQCPPLPEIPSPGLFLKNNASHWPSPRENKYKYGPEIAEANSVSRSKPSRLLGLWAMGHLERSDGGITVDG